MKKITHLKSLSFLIAFLSVVSFGFGQTILSAGDIAITGFNSDDPDEFSFVLLTDITNTTTINFTDNGWFSSGSFRNNEGTVTWTADSDIACGTEIVVTGGASFSASTGTALETNAGFSLSINGDQILAYQGTDALPTFIYAVHFDGTGWSTDATNPNTSAIPAGLTNGTNAVAINETDNGTYDCNTTSDFSAVLTAVSNNTNWTPSGTALTLGDCYYSCDTCSGGTVTWNGTWSGTPSSTTQVIIANDYDTSIGGVELQVSFSACSLKIENGATLNIANNDYVEVENALTIESGCFITVQPYGAFVQNNDTSTNSIYGSISVVKKTSDLNVWYEYTYWSSPVSGETIGGGLSDSEVSRRYLFNSQNFLDATAETGNNNDVLAGQDDVDDNGDDWQWLNGAAVMQPGVGYTATHSEAFFTGPPMSSPPYQFDYTFEGPFNNGVINVPVYRNDSETADNNWNLIGNPYPSAIDADLFLAANSNIATDVVTSKSINGAIFLWSQNTLPSSTANGNEPINFSNDDYAIINAVGENPGGDGVTPSRFIPSGQGFFVSMSNSAPATLVSGDVHTADVTFNNSMRMVDGTSNSQFFKNSNTKEKSTASLFNKLGFSLTSDNGVFNQILIGYVNNASDGDDGIAYDTPKYPTQGAALYSTIDNSNKKLAIQGKATNSLNEDEIINLGFTTYIDVATLYTLSIAQLQGDFLTNSPVYLKDNLFNKVHDLTICDYTFTSDVGEFNSRFEIAFSAAALSTENAVLDSKSLRIVDLDNNHVQFNVSENLSIKTINIYDLLGRQLYNLEGNSSSETYMLSNLNDAIYVAKVELSNGSIITKKAIKK